MLHKYAILFAINWQLSCQRFYALILIKKIGVLRDTARAPQPPTNQPTNNGCRRRNPLKKCFFQKT